MDKEEGNMHISDVDHVDTMLSNENIEHCLTLANTHADADEARLEALLFGGVEDTCAYDDDDDDGDSDGDAGSDDEDKPMFIVDKQGTKRNHVNSSDDDDGEENTVSKTIRPTLKPSWRDDSEDTTEVDIAAVKQLRKLRKTDNEARITGKEFSGRLAAQFTRIYGEQSWASLTNNGDSSDNMMGILQTTSGLIGHHIERLHPGKLGVTRMRNGNVAEPAQATIQSVAFHPSAPVLMTAGLDKTLRLFRIDGEQNPKIQSVFIKDMPIQTAAFTPDGDEIIMSGRRKFYYSFDMAAGKVTCVPGIRGRDERSWERFEVSPNRKLIAFYGKDGTVVLVCSRTKQWIGNLKMNGQLRAMAFSADGSRLYTSGTDAQVYVWDMATRTCLHRFDDDGCTTSTSLAISGDGAYVACGSDSGVVNVYGSDTVMGSSTPEPLKAIMNLTTRVDTLSFNPDSQILAMSSRSKKDALKLVHVPSFGVFSNWPSSNTPLHYMHSFAFSSRGGLMAAGNDSGKVLLYKINHYHRKK